MTPPPPLFHALLRPAVLQILRAAGYHGAKPSVIDAVTDLAARYFLHLCRLTALYATHNSNDAGSIRWHYHYPPIDTDETDLMNTNVGGLVVPASEHPAAPTIVDVRMALQRAGALLPERPLAEQEYRQRRARRRLAVARGKKGAGDEDDDDNEQAEMETPDKEADLAEKEEEDMRGVEAFLRWATGPVNREITRVALDGDDEAADYLDGEFYLRFISPVLSHDGVLTDRRRKHNSPQKEAQQERRRLKVPRHAARPEHRPRGRAGGRGRLPEHLGVGGAQAHGGAADARAAAGRRERRRHQWGWRRRRRGGLEAA